MASHTAHKSCHPARLLELLNPRSDWRVLDITTAESGTAPYLAQYVQSVVTLKPIPPESYSTQWPVSTQQAGNIILSHVNEEALPFASASFDCVICWLTAHRFSNVALFVQEVVRVLAPDGVLALADLITSGEPRIARYVNTLNRLHDPSHVWAFSLDDWKTFFFSAGLRVLHSEITEEKVDLDEWATNSGISGDDLTRLRALITRAPSEVRSWLRPHQVGHRLIFTLAAGIVLGHRKAKETE